MYARYWICADADEADACMLGLDVPRTSALSSARCGGSPSPRLVGVVSPGTLASPGVGRAGPSPAQESALPCVRACRHRDGGDRGRPCDSASWRSRVVLACRELRGSLSSAPRREDGTRGVTMHRAPKRRSQLRTRQRARTTLNASWFDAPTPTSGGAVRDDATTEPTTTPKIDESEETPSKQHGE